MRRFFSIFLTICISVYCNSQEHNIRFSRIGTEDGLSASWVRSVYQDRHGFIWFGTSDGLNRYDGYEMKVFKPAENDTNSLTSESIQFISEISDHLLWICTTQGVSIMDIDILCFYPFPYLNNIRVNHVMTDNEGRDWFSTYRGLFIYNRSDSSIINYCHDARDPGSLKYDQVSSCFQDRSGNIWVATERGADLYLPQTKSFFHISNDRMAREFIQDRDGRIWIGYNEKGLDVLMPDSSSPEMSHVERVSDFYVNSLLINSDNQLWIGKSMGLGISVFDLNTYRQGKISSIQITGNAENSGTLSDNSISCLYADRQGGIWAGTYAGGVNFYHRFKKQFNYFHDSPGEIRELKDEVVNCFFFDDTYFWIGTEGGLFRLDLITKKVNEYKHNPSDPMSLGANGVICINKDSKGNLWIGTWNGSLNRYNYQTDSFTRFFTDESKAGALNSKNIFVVHEDQQGNLLIGTNGGGLNIFNYNTKTFRSYVPEKNNEKSIYNNSINDICETSDGKIYISVYHSLELFDYTTGNFQHYFHNPEDSSSIGSGSILDIFEDSKKNIWIGTSNGLNLLNSNGTFRRFNMTDGLPNNTVQAIQEDDRGNLWLSTNNGLSKFVAASSLPEIPVFHNYHVTDGLKGNEFVRRSVYKHSDGWLYFGGTRGYTFFHPDSIFENKVPPVVALTDFRLVATTPDKGKELLSGDINITDRIELDYSQCNFRFQFAALNYIDPQNNRYKYLLQGYETEWHDIGNQREATYTNIDPGKYTFLVSGSNNDGVWSLKPKSIEIVINPPWWETWLFRALLALLAVSAIYLIFRIRLSMLRWQKKMLEEKVTERTTALSDLNTILEEHQEEISLQNEELSKHRTNLEKQVEERTEAMKIALKRAEEADRLKSAFLANMSHEIRTPMNAIVGFAALLNREDLSEEERKEFTDIISNNCNTLMVLINDILEISLIEANQIKLKNEQFDAVKILEELESYFNLDNKKNLEIKYIRIPDEKELIIKSDLTRFRQIFTNLLNNAYKYTESGFIHFGYSKAENSVEFFVSDTGIGIDESEYQNIFNFFHKIDKGENQFYRGAGIGLSISNKLIELMGGRIWLKSKMGEGTTFFLSFDTEKPGKKLVAEIPHSVTKVLPSRGLEDRIIVVAEDDFNNYMLIEKILEKTNAIIFWAKNGLEAVDYIRKMENKDKCMVIMDIKMPVMNGIRASEEIRKIHPGIPVIAVTAYAQIENRREILRHNFVDYIAKPLKPKILLDILTNQLQIED